MKFLKLTNGGSLRIAELWIRKDSVVTVQRPMEGKFGCIVTTANGEKYPLKETYDEVLRALET